MGMVNCTNWKVCATEAGGETPPLRECNVRGAMNCATTNADVGGV